MNITVKVTETTPAAEQRAAPCARSGYNVCDRERGQ